MSTAQLVRKQIEALPPRSFISTSEVEGPRHAVECELSRLAKSGEVIRARRGLYWKGPLTPIGMPLPRAFDVGMAIAGPGAGPASVSAASYLRLTTQVPSVATIAVAGRAHTPPAGVRFVSRSIERRIHGMTPAEVAVLEILRDGYMVVEASWTRVAETVARLGRDAVIRPWLITEQLDREHHIEARQRWSELS